MQTIHVLDLPQLYQKPSAETLLAALDLTEVQPPSWGPQKRPSRIEDDGKPTKPQLEGNPADWLTSIVASPLSWIEDEEMQEKVWSVASRRIAERCGRTARPSATRKFVVPREYQSFHKNQESDMEITLHEPTMEGDNLGLKTWASAYQVSTLFGSESFVEKLVNSLRPVAPSESVQNPLRVLELGAGTGLVGIAAAINLPPSTLIHLTDLPEVVTNLTRNVSLNADLFPSGTIITSGVLDWREQASAPSENDKYDLILSADSIYSKEHPALVSEVVSGWLKRTNRARCIVGNPFRDMYMDEITDLRLKLQDRGLKLIEEGEGKGWDDWGSGDEGQEVKCWWGMFGWSEENITSVGH